MKTPHIEKILEYYVGKTPPERQEFIIERLRVDIDQLKPSEIEDVTEDIDELETIA